jgi:hypothetical protein
MNRRMFIQPLKVTRKHEIGLGVGSIGWVVNVLTHFRTLDNILLFVLVPGFMLVGDIAAINELGEIAASIKEKILWNQ